MESEGGETALDRTVSGTAVSGGISGSKTWLLSEINSKIKIWFPTFLSTKKISQDSVSCSMLSFPGSCFLMLCYLRQKTNLVIQKSLGFILSLVEKHFPRLCGCSVMMLERIYFVFVLCYFLGLQGKNLFRKDGEFLDQEDPNSNPISKKILRKMSHFGVKWR